MKYTSKYMTHILCPYYLSEYYKSITCEGMGTAQVNVSKFETEKTKDTYIEQNCLYYPNGCPLSKANDKKWGD